ncbi:MAG: stage V sporulation protein AE, partial [Anaerovorax sp.]
LGALTGSIKNTAAGITAAVVFGYFIAILFSPKSKR